MISTSLLDINTIVRTFYFIFSTIQCSADVNSKLPLPEHFYLLPERLEFPSVAAPKKKVLFRCSTFRICFSSNRFSSASIAKRYIDYCDQLKQAGANITIQPFHVYLCAVAFPSTESQCAWALLEYMWLWTCWSIYANGVCRLKYVRVDASAIWRTVFYSTRTNTLWRA